MDIYAALADLIDDSSALKIGYRCWAIVRRSGLVVEMVFCFDDMNGYPGPSQEESEEESRWSSTDNDNLERSVCTYYRE